jgi:cell division protein ZapB
VNTLQEENKRLNEDVAGEVQTLRQENQSLKQELEQAKESKQAVVERIDRLLLKLRAATDVS